MISQERDFLKERQYLRAAERDAYAGIGKRCVLCSVGIPGGTGQRVDYHEILPKSELRGLGNLELLFALENIAPVCREHHDKFQHYRLIWQKSMVKSGLARPEQYEVAPFSQYWDGTDFPPTMECRSRFGYGSEYFRSAEMPESLARVYRKQDADFDTHRFCDFCGERSVCRLLTIAGAKKEDAVLFVVVPGITDG